MSDKDKILSSTNGRTEDWERETLGNTITGLMLSRDLLGKVGRVNRSKLQF